MKSGRWGMVMAAAVVLQTASASAAEPALDYELFKSQVEPIFLKKREGHTRCYVCHAPGNSAFRLEKLSPGNTNWTEEQSRRNFQSVSRLVVPGNPSSSLLLTHGLAPEAGGAAYHQGGRQFASRNDPDWKIIAQWAEGQKQAAGK